MNESGWSCPHCGTTVNAAELSDGSVWRCPACVFAHPAAVDSWADAIELEPETLTDTAVRSWAPVRAERYVLLRALATGAQGRLLLARDKHLDQLCVVKILKPMGEDWADIAITRLQNEARAGVAVNHPNVARVFDCDCVEGSWYFVMEYVPGRNLRKMVRSVDRLPWAQAVEIGIQAALGLAAIHQAGLIHRDVKPSNLMLRPDGVVKIMDLGLVKIQSADPDLAVTRVGQLLGTPYYMAPEQFEAGGTVAPQADVYGLGATLYHLVVGRAPFEGTGVLEIAQRHRHEPVVWPEPLAAEVPSWFRQVVDVCLAKRPEHRYPSAEALAAALRSGADQSVMVSPSAGTTPQGVTVMAFRNISSHSEDDWIGDAIAECLTNRLMQLDGVRVADRAGFARMLERSGSLGESGPDHEQVLEAARMVGASSVAMGGFQRAGSDLRITAHLVSADRPSPQTITTVSGPADKLFELEDQVGERLIELIGPAQSADRPLRRSATGTDSLEAMEKFIRGRRAFADGNYPQAIELAEQARSLDSEYLEPISLIGVCYARLGQYDKAVEYHQQEERRARELDDPPHLAEALSNIGVMYYYQGEYPVAYEFLERATEISKELGLRGESAKYLGNLGFVFMRLNRYGEAEDTFAEAIRISKESGDLVSLMWPYNGMGSVLLKQQRYTEAREYYQRALALAEEIGDRVQTGVSQMNLGRCACLLEEFEEAQSKFDAALAILQGTDFWNGLTLVYEYLAEMHLRMDSLPKALACIAQRIDLARRHGNNRMEAEACEQKARAYEQMGQTDEAIKALKESVTISQRPAPYESLHVYLEEVCKRPAFH